MSQGLCMESLNKLKLLSILFLLSIHSISLSPVFGLDVFSILNNGGHPPDKHNNNNLTTPSSSIITSHDDDDSREEESRTEENVEKMKPHDLPPQVTITGKHGWDNVLQCQYAHPDSNSLWLSFIECHSPKKCQQKLPCLLHNRNCAPHDKVTSSGQMYRKGEAGSIKIRLNSDSGMVACTSDPEGDQRLVRRTVDFFYRALDLKRHLASTPLSTQNLSVIEIEVFRFSKKSSLRWTWNRTAYVNEEILISCHMAPFLYMGPKYLGLFGTKKDGSILSLDLTMEPVTGYHNKRSASVRFRIPANVVALTCSAKESLSQSTIEEVISFKTEDLPLNFTLKSSTTEDGAPFEVPRYGKLGCDFHGTLSQKKALDWKLFETDDIVLEDGMTSIRSLIDLLRLKEMGGGNFSCQIIVDQSLSLGMITTHFDYFADMERLWPLPPKIDKVGNGGGQVITLSGPEHRTLSCKYGGQPMPYIFWLKDGKEFSYDIGTPDEDDDDRWEISWLKVDVGNFKSNNNYTTINFTCMAVNGLGYDSLEFMVQETPATKSPTVLEPNFNYDYTWLILWCLTLIGLVVGLLGLIYYRKKYLFTKKFLHKTVTQAKANNREDENQILGNLRNDHGGHHVNESVMENCSAENKVVVRYQPKRNSRYKILLEDL